MKTMTLDDVKNMSELSKEEEEAIKNFKNTDFSDCPKQTQDQLSQFQPYYQVHSEWYKPKKSDLHMKIDTDVLQWFKSRGKGYQTKINEVLRNYALTFNEDNKSDD